MILPGARHGPARRRGTVLVVTMVLIFALAGMTLALCRSMRVEVIASSNHAAMLQATAVERGAEQYLQALLVDQEGTPGYLSENYFAAVPVGEGFFWVLRPDYGDPALPMFGLTGESAKLNINTASVNQLLLLPYMTEDVAAAIVDWRDEDEDVSTEGAETEFYLSQPEGYYCKNAAFETVEELLLVRNFMPELLYGTGPAMPLGTSSVFSGSGLSMLNDVWVQRGIGELLTVCSKEPQTAADGTQRVSITDRNARGQLRDLLRNQFGNSRGDEIVNAAGEGDLRDIFDLYFRARMTATELSQIIDYIAPSQASGRIDVNTAPREVLLTIGSLELADVDALLSQRIAATSAEPSSIAWVAEALGQKAVGLGNRITGRSYQYTAHIVAVSGNGRAFKQVRIIIDVSSGTPQIIYRRDITERGWPMDPQILASMRAGEGPGAWAEVGGSRLGGTLR